MNLIKLYNSFDTQCKRCIIIDVYSLLFIILPKKYYLSKLKGLIWSLLLIYLLIRVKGKDEVFIIEDKYINIE